ncbi:hypothetical protein HNP21_006278 [Bacillus aryabhattai]|uniref:Fascin-like domain-containing protein n=1 Tax=Priestia aryabhattai TaxID=412384 RepID=A0A7W3RI86_PRIAR|nr:hypothetical protein [Priestia aryabhattai]MBA9043100.1 hypothetical protein [Priestia aryabhattai]
MYYYDPYSNRYLDDSFINQRQTWRMALRGFNGKYVAAPDGGTHRQLIADRDVRDIWETFTLIQTPWEGRDRYALRTHNGTFVTADLANNGIVKADARHIGEWEIFRVHFFMWERRPRLALQADRGNGYYVSADPNKGYQLAADRPGVGEWERFGYEYF